MPSFFILVRVVLAPATAVLAALLTCPGPAQATLVKCRGEQGSVVYQDLPCREGTELRNLDTDPATVSVVPGLSASQMRYASAASTQAAPLSRTRADSRGRRQSGPTISAGKAAERRFIRTGMTEVEVIRRIGKPEVDATPSANKRKQGKGSRLWSYLPAVGDPDTITTVTLAGGMVTGIERKIVR